MLKSNIISQNLSQKRVSLENNERQTSNLLKVLPNNNREEKIYSHSSHKAGQEEVKGLISKNYNFFVNQLSLQKSELEILARENSELRRKSGKIIKVLKKYNDQLQENNTEL